MSQSLTTRLMQRHPWLTVSLAALTALPAPANPQLAGDVFAAGGTAATCGSCEVTDTIGQSLIGEATSNDGRVSEGFWPITPNPPSAAARRLAVRSGQTATYSINDLLSAYSSGGGALAIISVSPSSAHGGSVSLSAGLVTYKAPAYTGEDTFSFVMTDSDGDTVTASAFIDVTPKRTTLMLITSTRAHPSRVTCPTHSDEPA